METNPNREDDDVYVVEYGFDVSEEIVGASGCLETRSTV